MGLFKLFAGYTATKHLLHSTQPRPQPINIHLHIELPDDEDDSPIGSHEEDWTSPPIYDAQGQEVDEDGFPVSDIERDYRKYRRMEAQGSLPSPIPLSRAEKRQKRAEVRERQQEELRQMMQGLDEMDTFLKDHTPEEYEQWLLEHNQ